MKPLINVQEFERGYFCAVSVLLRETCAYGVISTDVRSLFEQGGDPKNADPEDLATFKRYGLLKNDTSATVALTAQQKLKLLILTVCAKYLDIEPPLPTDDIDALFEQTKVLHNDEFQDAQEVVRGSGIEDAYDVKCNEVTKVVLEFSL